MCLIINNIANLCEIYLSVQMLGLSFLRYFKITFQIQI